MHIGILGGSFNPPHIGHLLVMQQVLDFTHIERIWLMPAYRHTFDKPLAPVADRLAMAKLTSLPDVSISTLEVDHRLDGNTINLLPVLKKNYPNDQFTFIIGSDQLSAFTRWGKWEDLLDRLPFLVVPRAGYPPQPWFDKMELLSHSLLVTTNISSSTVRARIKNHLPITYFVTSEVESYIVSKKLYQS